MCAVCGKTRAHQWKGSRCTACGAVEKFLEAVEAGNLEEVKALLEKGADKNIKDMYGRTPLHHAIWKGHAPVVEYLVEKGADVEAEDFEKERPLHWAAVFGRISSIRCLLAHGANLEAEDKNGFRPLHKAVRETREAAAVIEIFLQNGADRRAKTKSGETPYDLARKACWAPAADLLVEDPKEKLNASLHKAVRKADAAAVRECIASGANVNSLDVEGNYPLQRAALALTEDSRVSDAAFLEILDALIAAGADVNAQGREELWSDDYTSPLLMAASRVNAEAVIRLLRAGADPHVKDSEGRSAFQLARKNGTDYRYKETLNNFWRIVEVLEEGRAWSLTKEGKELRAVYETVCADAFKDADWRNVQELEPIVQKADIAALVRCVPQFNAFHNAAHRGHAHLIQMMLDKGVDVNCRATTGETALVMALEYGYGEHVLNADVVRILLENGASRDLIGDSGHTPVALATYLSKCARDPKTKNEAALALKYLAEQASAPGQEEKIEGTLYQDFARHAREALHLDQLFVVGERLEGSKVAVLAKVGMCLSETFEAMLPGEREIWNAACVKELSALKRSWQKINLQFPSSAGLIDTQKVRELACLYVSRVSKDASARANLAAGTYTLFWLTIDFGNALGCGGALKTALEWYG